MQFEESVEGHKELSLQIFSFSLRMQCTKLGENLDGFVRIRAEKNCNECNIEACASFACLRTCLEKTPTSKSLRFSDSQVFPASGILSPKQVATSLIYGLWSHAQTKKAKRTFKLLNSRGIKSGFESCEQKVVAKQNFVMISNTFGPSHFHPEKGYQATQTSQTQGLSKFRDPNVAARPTLPNASQADQQARIGRSKSRFSPTENIVRHGNIMILYKLCCLRL